MEPEYHHLLPRSSLPRVSASESSDTHCAVPLCYLFPSQVYAAHTHTYTQLVPSFDCHNTAVSSPLFLLLSTANSLRFQLQTLVRPFLIIFQLPSAVFVCHSPLPSQGRDNFSPPSLSRFRTLGKFSRRYAGRNAEETFHRSIVRPRGSQFRRIQESRREKKGERTKLNL